MTIRCAIYTRKSSEEGLEQQFNSPITGSNDPLYVIDGLIVYNDNSSTRTGVGSPSDEGGEGRSLYVDVIL